MILNSRPALAELWETDAFEAELNRMISSLESELALAAEARWMRLDGRDRARMFVGWLHGAAEEYRARLARKKGRSAQGVA